MSKKTDTASDKGPKENSAQNIRNDKKTADSGARSKKTTSKKTQKKTKVTEIEELTNKTIEINDKYLRLSAEFDNYRKRTLKEKMELTRSGGESILINLLPVVDNFERALASIETTNDMNSVKDGIKLIHSNFNEFLVQNGIKEIEAKNKKFDTDVHEAISKIKAPKKSLKGKVVDIIEKGYYLHDKVIRYAKVVIGE